MLALCLVFYVYLTKQNYAELVVLIACNVNELVWITVNAGSGVTWPLIISYLNKHLNVLANFAAISYVKYGRITLSWAQLVT